MKFMWLKLFVLVSVLALFSCGGDDGASSEEAEKDSGGSSDASLEVSEDVETYESLDDLPNCTEKRLLSLAKVKSAYYVCADRKWKKVEDAVQQICDVPSCDESAENGLTYVKETNQLFQCNSGKWTDSDGAGLSVVKYIQCVMDRVATVSVKTEDDLNSCTKSRQGNVALVDEDFWVCYNSKWAPLDGVVMNQSSLPECVGSADGSLYYAAENLTLYRCNMGETVNVPTSSVAVSSESSSPVQNSSSSAKPKSSATSVNSSNSGVSSSSKVSSSTSTVNYTTRMVGPTSEWGKFAFIVPVEITEGEVQNIYFRVDQSSMIAGPSTWKNFRFALGQYDEDGFIASTVIYPEEAFEIPSYAGAIVTTDGSYVKVSYRKSGTWLENYETGKIVSAAVVIVSDAEPAEDSSSPLDYDYYSLPSGAALYYRYTDEMSDYVGYRKITEMAAEIEMANGECAVIRTDACAKACNITCRNSTYYYSTGKVSIVGETTVSDEAPNGYVNATLLGKNLKSDRTFCVELEGITSVRCQYL